MPKYGDSEGRTSVRTFRLYEGDILLVDWLASFYGTSKSDAVRTAIRSHAAQMKAIHKEVK